jgi:dipeptidyl-peptidase 4
MTQRFSPRLLASVAALAACATLRPAIGGAQDVLTSLPGYGQYERMLPQLETAVSSGALNVVWAADGRSFEYVRDGKRYRYDVAARAVRELGEATTGGASGRFGGRGGRGRGAGPARGRQFTEQTAPDSAHVAFFKDDNLWVRDADGGHAIGVTTDGSAARRIKYGTASWVYGEELGQRTAFWWSPDGKKLAYYRFDESRVPDYYLQMAQTTLYDSVNTEAYPKPGVPNPTVDLFVYDLASGKTTRLDVRDGRPFENDVVGYYVYNVNWSPDGGELTLNRTNRRQNVMEFTGCNPDTGACHAIVRESWPTGWVQNHPYMRYLADGHRFIWESERTGFRNYYLYDLNGTLLATLTHHAFETAGVLDVDERAGLLYYMARDGDNFMKLQLHRVHLDGTGDARLTDPAFNHRVALSPDRRFFVDVAETHEVPPTTRLMATDGTLVAALATSDMSHYRTLGLTPAEMFTYKAADGVTTLHGMISFPSNFDPKRTYPVLVSVYGGPASGSNTARETFVTPNPLTEFGFLVVNLDSRAAPGMGKRQLDAIYLKLGQTEMDDMAEGVKALWGRPYVDSAHVGIYGTSYGGYTSLMELVRHPEVFAAASAASPPTDWRNYDTIYTERYMWIPQENEQGYDLGSAMHYVDQMKGRLLIYYGSADNNVHPTNSMEMIRTLQRAGKSFEVQVGPDMGHSAVNTQRMMEFFIENLKMKRVPLGTN